MAFISAGGLRSLRRWVNSTNRGAPKVVDLSRVQVRGPQFQRLLALCEADRTGCKGAAIFGSSDSFVARARRDAPNLVWAIDRSSNQGMISESRAEAQVIFSSPMSRIEGSQEAISAASFDVETELLTHRSTPADNGDMENGVHRQMRAEMEACLPDRPSWVRRGFYSDYRLGERLGGNDQNHVFLATDRDGNKFAARILSHPDRVSQIFQHGESLLKLHSPYASETVAIYQDCNLHTGLEEAIVVDKYVGGYTLEQHLEMGTGFGRGDLRSILSNILSVIKATSELGFHHRDIKPSNIKYDKATGVATLIDFGDAKYESGAVSRDESLGAGTDSFHAPEQIGLIATYITAATDIFALGLTLGVVATGVKRTDDFRFDSLPKIISKLRTEEILHPDFIDRVEMMIDLDPRVRMNVLPARWVEKYPLPESFLRSLESDSKEGENLSATLAVKEYKPFVYKPSKLQRWAGFGLISFGLTYGVAASGFASISGTIGGGMLAIVGAILFWGEWKNSRKDSE